MKIPIVWVVKRNLFVEFCGKKQKIKKQEKQRKARKTLRLKTLRHQKWEADLLLKLKLDLMGL